MAARHYSPQINRVLVCALYHEAKARKKPMTQLTDQLLSEALKGTSGMEIANRVFPSSACDLQKLCRSDNFSENSSSVE